MTDIWIPNREVCCPLCGDPFVKQRLRRHGKEVVFYVCQKDKIFTFAFDPAFDKWDRSDMVIPCPSCGETMRWFARAIDSVFRAKCPSCGVCMDKDSEVKVSPKGEVSVPDFEEAPAKDEEEIYIPIDKMRMSEDRKRAFKNKRRRA